MDFNFKKKYGQNFLKDKRIIDSIVLKSGADKDTLVLEIGPGAGALTSELVKKAGHVIAFEIDESLKDILDSKLNEYNNVEVLYGDFLETNVNEIIRKYDYSKKIMVSNLPYYITTPILFKLLEYRDKISSIVIMVQREVAQRLLAEPKSKEYGVLTVNTGYVSDMSLVTIVPNTSFVPAPNVTSAVVKMDINLDKLKNIKDEEMFKKLVKASFSARRKKVINSIMNSNLFNFSKEQLTEYIKRIGFSECVRAEEISVDKYIELANMIKESTC